MDSSSHNTLQGCVGSLRSSMQLLESSINILDTGVSDYPRLAKVLQTTRVSQNILLPPINHIAKLSIYSTSN